MSLVGFKCEIVQRTVLQWGSAKWETRSVSRIERTRMMPHLRVARKHRHEFSLGTRVAQMTRHSLLAGTTTYEFLFPECAEHKRISHASVEGY